MKIKRHWTYWMFFIISLLPIFLWPLVSFTSVFLFDDPNADIRKTTLLFYLINGYPIYFIANAYFSYQLYKKYKQVAYGLLIGAILLVITLLVILFLVE